MRSLKVPAPDREHFAARVMPLEIATALFRRVKAGTIPLADVKLALASLRNDVSHAFQTVELTGEVAEEGLVIAERHALRGYDCVHLAILMVVNRCRGALGHLTLVSADSALNQAVSAEGRGMLDPNAVG